MPPSCTRRSILSKIITATRSYFIYAVAGLGAGGLAACTRSGSSLPGIPGLSPDQSGGIGKRTIASTISGPFTIVNLSNGSGIRDGSGKTVVAVTASSDYGTLYASSDYTSTVLQVPATALSTAGDQADLGNGITISAPTQTKAA